MASALCAPPSPPFSNLRPAHASLFCRPSRRLAFGPLPVPVQASNVTPATPPLTELNATLQCFRTGDRIHLSKTDAPDQPACSSPPMRTSHSRCCGSGRVRDTAQSLHKGGSPPPPPPPPGRHTNVSVCLYKGTNLTPIWIYMHTSMSARQFVRASGRTKTWLSTGRRGQQAEQRQPAVESKQQPPAAPHLQSAPVPDRSGLAPAAHVHAPVWQQPAKAGAQQSPAASHVHSLPMPECSAACGSGSAAVTDRHALAGQQPAGAGAQPSPAAPHLQSPPVPECSAAAGRDSVSSADKLAPGGPARDIEHRGFACVTEWGNGWNAGGFEQEDPLRMRTSKQAVAFGANLWQMAVVATILLGLAGAAVGGAHSCGIHIPAVCAAFTVQSSTRR